MGIREFTRPPCMGGRGVLLGLVGRVPHGSSLLLAIRKQSPGNGRVRMVPDHLEDGD